MTTEEKSGRGFAGMTPEKRSEVGKAGGIRVHAMGRAHEFTPELAKEAGKKGGEAVKAKYGREHYVALGKKGAQASAARRAARVEGEP